MMDSLAEIVAGSSVDALTEMLIIHGRVATLLLICLIVFPYINKKCKRSAAGRHIILSIGLLSTALLPLSSQLMPTYDLIIETNRSVLSSELTSAISEAFRNSSHSAERLIPASSGLVIAYLCVALIALWKVFFSNIKIHIVTRCCQPVQQRYWTKKLARYRVSLGISRAVTIKHSRLVHSPMTWGLFRPVILIPSQALHWPDAMINSTLLHELAHIKRQDWLTHQLARCVCAIYWINPLCWKALKQLHMYAEKASDDIVLSSGKDSANYANNLVDVANHLRLHGRQTRAALGMLANKKPSELRMRVQALLNPTEQHTPLTKTQFLVATSLILFMLVPLASFRANIIEKVNFVVSYNEKSQETMPLPTLSEQIEETAQDEQKAPTIADIKNMVYEPVVTPARPQEARAQQQPEIAIVKTEINTLSASDILARAKQKIVQSIDTNDADAASADEDHRTGDTVGSTEVSALKKDAEAITPVKSAEVLEVAEKTPLIEENHVVKRLEIPRYPKRARIRGIEGEVTIEYGVDSYGKVVGARVISATPKNIFNRAVLRAINKSEFIPKKINGEPVSTTGLQEKYVFILES